MALGALTGTNVDTIPGGEGFSVEVSVINKNGDTVKPAQAGEIMNVSTGERPVFSTSAERIGYLEGLDRLTDEGNRVYHAQAGELIYRIRVIGVLTPSGAQS